MNHYWLLFTTIHQPLLINIALQVSRWRSHQSNQLAICRGHVRSLNLAAIGLAWQKCGQCNAKCSKFLQWPSSEQNTIVGLTWHPAVHALHCRVLRLQDGHVLTFGAAVFPCPSGQSAHKGSRRRLFHWSGTDATAQQRRLAGHWRWFSCAEVGYGSKSSVSWAKIWVAQVA